MEPSMDKWARLKRLVMQLFVSIVVWGIGGVIAYFVMLLIPGLTGVQWQMVIPLFLLAGVIMGVFQIIKN
jgi:uncharacterized membrane protein YbhN (UPF0104 family)